MISRGRNRVRVAATSLALLAPVVAGCGEDGDDGASGGAASGATKSAVTVNIASFEFTPDPIRVKAGGKVTWANRDKAPHTAETGSESKPGFDTGRLDLGEHRTVSFDSPGRFRYYCVYHRFMTGSVEVVE